MKLIECILATGRRRFWFQPEFLTAIEERQEGVTVLWYGEKDHILAAKTDEVIAAIAGAMKDVLQTQKKTKG